MPGKIEAQLKEIAQAQGISVAKYVEILVTETNLRRTQFAEFRATIAERIASLKEGESAYGEDVMRRLIADLAPR